MDLENCVPDTAIPEDRHVYHDDDATEFAEERMCEAVLNCWEKTRPVRRRTWWDQPAIRSLDDERTFAMLEIAEALAKEDAAKRSRRRGGSGAAKER